MSYHTLSIWMVSHHCGFFHVSLNHLPVWMPCHTLSNWMVFHQCGFFHESSNHLTAWISCCTLSSWMVSHQCGFFHVSLNWPETSLRQLKPIRMQIHFYEVRPVPSLFNDVPENIYHSLSHKYVKNYFSIATNTASTMCKTWSLHQNE